MIRLPTAVDPVKAILRTSGCSTSRHPTSSPVPTTTFSTPCGQPGLECQLAQAHRRQRSDLGRLDDGRVAGGERRPDLPRGHHHREVPRRDQADDAERLVERHVDAAGDRDRRTRVLVDRPGEVVDARRPRHWRTTCCCRSACPCWRSPTGPARRRAQRSCRRNVAAIGRDRRVRPPATRETPCGRRRSQHRRPRDRPAALRAPVISSAGFSKVMDSGHESQGSCRWRGRRFGARRAAFSRRCPTHRATATRCCPCAARTTRRTRPSRW